MDGEKDSGSKVFLIVGGALCALLLLGGIGTWFAVRYAYGKHQERYAPTAPTEAAYKGETPLSEPSDPWAVPAPPLLGTLVVLPFRDPDGIITSQGWTLQESVLWPWEIAAPEGVAVIEHDVVRNTLWTMTPVATPGRPGDDVLRDLVAFWGASHIVSATIWNDADQRVIVDAVLSTPDGDHEHSFEAPPKSELVLSRDISRWIAATTGWPIADRERRVLEAKPWGEEFDSLDDERFGPMQRTGAGPEWASALANNPDNPLLKVWRAKLFDDLGNDGQLALLDPGPLPADAPAWDREIRARALLAKDEYRAARHEVEILLATRPGSARHAMYGLFELLKKEEDHRRRADIAARWRERAAASPWADAVQAQVCRQVAWQFRGTGWASTVSSDDWHFFGTFNDKALELYEGVLRRGAPIPWVCDDLMTIHGSGSGDADMMRVLALCSSRYPDYVDTWSTALNYTRPRWGGSHAQAIEIVDKALATSTGWRMGSLGMLYCPWEADLEFKGTPWIDRLRKFCDAHPECEQMLRRCAAHCMDNAGPDEPGAFAWAASTAVALQDNDWLEEIVARRPDFWKASRDNYPNGWDGQVLYKMQYMLFEHANWQNSRDMIETLLEHDAYWREKPKGGAHVANSVEEQGPYFALGFAETMTGDADKGIARMKAAEERLPWHGRILSASLLIADREVAETAAKVEAQHAEDPEDRDTMAVLALARWRQGDRDEALRLIGEAQSRETYSSLSGMYPDIRRMIETDASPTDSAPADAPPPSDASVPPPAAP